MNEVRAALEGANLDLAVAWVMMPKLRGGVNAYIRDGECWVCWDLEGDIEEWSPSAGGSGAWAVLGWVRDCGYRVTLNGTSESRSVCLSDVRSGVMREVAIGVTDAIALCRAVVALDRPALDAPTTSARTAEPPDA